MIPSLRKLAGSLTHRDTAGRELVSGSLVSFVIQGAGAGLIFLSEVLIARVLDVSSYGLFATVMAWIQVLAMVALLGSNHLLLRFVPAYVAAEDWPHLRGLIKHCQRVSIGLGIALFVGCGAILAISHERIASDTRWAFLIGMAILPVAALSLQRQAILRGLHRVAVALTPELLVRPACLILAVASLAWVFEIRLGAPHVLAVSALMLILAFGLGQYWLRQSMPAQTYASPARSLTHDWIKIALPLFLIAVLQLLIVRLDIMLLGILQGHDAAGHYAAASRVADLIVFALASANVIVAPLIAGLHARNDLAGMQRMLTLLAWGVTLFTLPLVLVVVFWGRPILGFFGMGYDVAYVSLLILVGGQVVNALSGPVDFVMSMTGQQVKMLQILATATVLNLLLNLLLIPPFGLTGAAIATASTTVFWNLYMRRIVRQRLGIDPSVLVLLRRRG